MTDLSAQLAAADRRLALTQPQQHPRPQPIQQEARRQALRARQADTKKQPSFAKQLLAVKQLRKAAGPQPQANLPLPPATPEQRKRDEDVRQEVQRDLCTALVKGTRHVAGRWCDEEKARRIESSPAVQELLARTTGWVHAAPDVGKLLLVIGSKLL